MLIWISEHLTFFYNKFNLSYYFFFRAITSLIISFFLSYKFTLLFINWSKKIKINQTIRKFGPKSHLSKSNTPTMGGIIIIISIIISILMCSCFSDPYIWYILFILISYGVIGFIDDYIKILFKDSNGLKASLKYFWQSLIAIIISIVIFLTQKSNLNINTIYFFKEELLKSSFLYYLILTYLVIVGTSNAVNLTDGLDGLAIMQVILVSIGLSIIAFITSNKYPVNYLDAIYIKNIKEIVIVCTSIIGTSLGFLWFNIHPAKIFMGDTGSLSLGGVIGIITVLLKQELLLLIIGGIFVIETLSVILQVLSYKIRGKCIFLMAPIHHHFELKGLPELVIVIRFWIISLLLVIIGLLIFNLN